MIGSSAQLFRSTSHPVVKQAYCNWMSVAHRCKYYCSESGNLGVLGSSIRRGTLYIHWPYCAQLCTYCNFNKYVKDSVDHEKHYECLVKEFQSALNKSSITSFSSVYFGGGTPSLAGPRLVEIVLEAVGRYSCLSNKPEICLEANPSSTQLSKLNEFKLAGVNRLSLGIQSLNDDALKLMNRDHSSEEGKRALENAISVFPCRVNTDIIFGRPGQSLTSWTEELKNVIQLIDNHLSLYQLTIERGTPLATAVRKKELTMPDDDTVAEMYEVAVELLEEVGLQRYEISNFAKQGFESQHNLSYWTGADYIGVGPGAHSRYLNNISTTCDDSDVTYKHTINVPEPSAWMNNVLTVGNGAAVTKQLSRLQRMEEVVATSLRTQEGLTNEIWKHFSPESLTANLWNLSSSDKVGFTQLLHSGLLILDDKGLRATGKGLNVLDSLLPQCISLLDK